LRFSRRVEPQRRLLLNRLGHPAELRQQFRCVWTVMRNGGRVDVLYGNKVTLPGEE